MGEENGRQTIICVYLSLAYETLGRQLGDQSLDAARNLTQVSPSCCDLVVYILLSGESVRVVLQVGPNILWRCARRCEVSNGRGISVLQTTVRRMRTRILARWVIMRCAVLVRPMA